MSSTNTNKQFKQLIIFLLAGAIAGNIYQFNENKKLREKIESFVPAAVALENDNGWLNNLTEKQEVLIQQLTRSRDSAIQFGTGRKLTTTYGQVDTLRTGYERKIPEQQGAGNFKDLNQKNNY